MSSFYTNVQSYNGKILYRGVSNGKKAKLRLNYEPSLFVQSDSHSTFKTLDGLPLRKTVYESISKAREYVKQFKDVAGAAKIYGNQNYEYAFIADKYMNPVEFDISKITVAAIDIETIANEGMPSPQIAKQAITAITIRYFGGNTYTFGCNEYKVQGQEIYIQCRDEKDLCERFLKLWVDRYPDVISGWYSDVFDMPYIINRLKIVLGEEEAKTISPWGLLWEQEKLVKDQLKKTYKIVGIAQLDYKELYYSFAPNGKTQENLKLETIANVELDEGKLSYEEYDSLHRFYLENYQRFIEYNIRDVDLIFKLEDKLKLLELAITLAYTTKSNFEDVFSQTRMWDSMIYSYLLNRGIIVPPSEVKEKLDRFEGAFVKEVLVGMHKWLASFDLDSLYPHIIMQYFISPENLVEKSFIQERKQKLISELKLRKTLNK